MSDEVTRQLERIHIPQKTQKAQDTLYAEPPGKSSAHVK